MFSAFEFLILFVLNYFLPVYVLSLFTYWRVMFVWIDLFSLFLCDLFVCFFVMSCDILLKIRHLKKASTSPMICGMDSQISLADSRVKSPVKLKSPVSIPVYTRTLTEADMWCVYHVEFVHNIITCQTRDFFWLICCSSVHDSLG